jgi:hypothetical protein
LTVVVIVIVYWYRQRSKRTELMPLRGPLSLDSQNSANLQWE